MTLLKRDTTKNLWKGGFIQKYKPQQAEPKTLLKQNQEKSYIENIFRGPMFQNEKRHPREMVPAVSAEITPKNRHCLRGLDAKYGKWDEIIPDIMNGKLRIIQNKKRTKMDSEDDDDDYDEEEED